MRAASLEFIPEKANVVFIGPAGVGKTHLSNAIGQLACLRGYRVRFTVAAGLVNDLIAGQTRNTLHRRLAAWAAPDVLIIDELGYLSFDARGADLLYQVFNKRYQRSSTIVTTNLAFKDWGKLFHNSAAASAIADRLVHKGLLIRIAAPPAIETPRFSKIVSTNPLSPASIGDMEACPRMVETCPPFLRITSLVALAAERCTLGREKWQLKRLGRRNHSRLRWGSLVSKR